MMSKPLETRPVYYHTCPALGANTKIPRAMRADRDSEYILGYQHKCPFCSATGGEFIPGVGVTVNDDDTYSVDTTKAEKLRGSE